VFTVLPLLQAVKVPLLVTTTTPTGAAVLQQQGLTHVQHQYLPVDFSGACQRFFKSATIKEGWIVETEIWPWLYASAKSRRIPLSIINARLSDRTSSHAKGFFATTFRQALSDVRVLARSTSDAEKFAQLGAVPQLITVLGNLKYANRAADEKPDRQKCLIGRPYFLAASTHDNEELQLSMEWLRHRPDESDVLLVIVPRHPERGPAIQKQLAAQGINSVLRSRHDVISQHDTVYIADTLGELQAWYTHAIAGFIGGSLIERGGHNLLEAARFGCPIVTGPHTFNFSDVVERLSAHDAITIADNAQQVIAFFHQVSEEPDTYASMVTRARTQAQLSEGVLSDYLETLVE